MLAKTEPEEDLSPDEAIAADESPKIDSVNLYLDENGKLSQFLSFLRAFVIYVIFV